MSRVRMIETNEPVTMCQYDPERNFDAEVRVHATIAKDDAEARLERAEERAEKLEEALGDLLAEVEVKADGASAVSHKWRNKERVKELIHRAASLLHSRV